MPTYEYLCKQCRYRFECVQRITDDPQMNCPECGSPVSRVPQPTGVHYRGTGWSHDDKWRFRRASGSPPIHGI